MCTFGGNGCAPCQWLLCANIVDGTNSNEVYVLLVMEFVYCLELLTQLLNSDGTAVTCNDLICKAGDLCVS